MKTRITGIMLALLLFVMKANSQLIIDSIHVTNATTCSLCNGTATAYLSGGISPYRYYWSNGETTQTNTGLCPGTYYLYVNDSLNFDSAVRVFLVGPPSLSLITNSTGSSCSSTGTASVNITGGVSPFTYSWSPGGGSTAGITGLSAGGYTVTVTDVNGCSKTDDVIVTGGLALAFTSTNVLCFGSSSGSISLTNVSGGVSPYTYSWSPSGGTNITATGLSAGSYTVTVTDNNGCAGTAIDSIGQPSPIYFDSANYITGAGCSNNNGSAEVMVGGGTYPYTYSWSPGGGSTQRDSGLSAGTYSVTITDHNGCTTTTSIAVPSTGPVPSISTVGDSCNGQSNGIAIVNSVSGGVAPYTYSWVSSGNTTSSISGLSAGVYSIVVTDNTGCSGTSSVYIYQPGILSFYADTIPDTGSCSGIALIVASGGTLPYTFSWSVPVNTIMDSAGLQEADSLCPGAYLVCVTDAHGCSNCDSVHIRHESVVTSVGNIKPSNSEIKLYPDPASDKLYITTDEMKTGGYTLYIYDMIGRLALQPKKVTVNPGELMPIDVSALPAGKYMLRMSSADMNKTAPFMVIH